MEMGELGTYQMFNRPYGMIGGMMNKSPEMANVPPNWQIYFLVPDITSAVERITAKRARKILKAAGFASTRFPTRTACCWI